MGLSRRRRRGGRLRRPARRQQRLRLGAQSRLRPARLPRRRPARARRPVPPRRPQRQRPLPPRHARRRSARPGLGPLSRRASPIRTRAGAGGMGRPHPPARRRDRAERARPPHRGGGAARVNLVETQRLFWEALRGESRDVEACFLGTPDLGAAERVRIYSDMFVWRQVDALREDFPEVAARLGEDGFFRLARAYVLAHPSEHPDLGRVEWARSEVFLEADRAPLETLALDPDRFAQARLRLIPALRLSGNTAVWRAGFEVFDVQLEAVEAQALRLALEGEPLGEICGAFGEPAPAFEAL